MKINDWGGVTVFDKTMQSGNSGKFSTHAQLASEHQKKAEALIGAGSHAEAAQHMTMAAKHGALAAQEDQGSK